MKPNKYASLFPGQGSQYHGMLSGAYERFPAVRETFNEASEAIGIDLWALTKKDNNSSINLTENTQPLLLSSSVALWREFIKSDVTPPAILAGHSLGEFSALVCAESLEFADAVVLVRNRGRYMQEAVPVGTGAMAAILGLEENKVDSICAECTSKRNDGLSVNAVNYNSPAQVVIAGHSEAVDEAIDALKEAGAKRAMLLPVSAPFHTPLMSSAGDRLAISMEDITFKEPKIAVLSNVTADIQSDPEQIKKLLVKQISSPVNWTGCIQFIVKKGIKHALEFGPGTVLTGLCRRIDKSLICNSLENPDSFSSAVTAIV